MFFLLSLKSKLSLYLTRNAETMNNSNGYIKLILNTKLQIDNAITHKYNTIITYLKIFLFL